MAAVKNLRKIQQKNRSIICLGLDLDPKRMPPEYSNSVKAMFDFTRRVIDATADLVCAYKPNMAFYESLGADGWSLLRLITERIPEEIPVIVDGKRGDIGNTASHYARSLFEMLRADWVTLNPYMGYDSLRPFLEHKDKGVFVLCLTSNSGAKDFQLLTVEGKPLYEVVAEKVIYWNKDHNCGLVVGATHPDVLKELRALAGDMPLLIPGVGAQGGSLEQAVLNGTDNFRKPAVINVSRSVLYASTGADFAERARAELEKLNATVNSLRPGARPADDVSGEAGSDEPAGEQPSG
ncbi:MAG TPA: orotidine-5'-phosphate decarboxylase [Acidobacteriota bacterium]|nr:orotidine-5'-phosphate decarboxylase [Acidobacteriota bacterium]